MSLSVEMKIFLKKWPANFSLACDVYHVFLTGKEVMPDVRNKVPQALRLAD